MPKAMTQFDRVVALGGDRNRSAAPGSRRLRLRPRSSPGATTWCSTCRTSHQQLRAPRDPARGLVRVRPLLAPLGRRAHATNHRGGAWYRRRLDTALELRGGGPDIDALLRRHGWKAGFDLVVLNPAGFSPARAWPTASYIEFARLWIERHPRSQIVLLLCPPSKRAKATEICHCPRRALHRSHGPCGPARSFRDRRAGAARAVGRLGSHAHGLDPGNTHARTLQRQPARLVGAAGELERLSRFLRPALRALRPRGLQVR